jgi:hypothetical protein
LAVDCWRCRLNLPSDECAATEAQQPSLTALSRPHGGFLLGSEIASDNALI